VGNSEIYFIHKGHDYGWFSLEIEQAFGIKPKSIEDLQKLKNEII
jgi:hypothetical protein